MVLESTNKLGAQEALRPYLGAKEAKAQRALSQISLPSESILYKEGGGEVPLSSQDQTRAYLIFVIFFTRAKFLENKIYSEKMRKLRQNTQKIANFLRYYGKIHSKLTIFRVKSVKIYTGQKKIYTNMFVGFVTNIRYERG